jgi:hypothetical protein
MKQVGVLEKLKAQNELTRKEIQKAVDPKFIHHALYTKELPVVNIGGAQFVELRKRRSRRVQNRKTVIEAVFNTGSATFPGEVTHVQRIIMEDLMDILQKKDLRMTLQQKLSFAMNQGDLRIGCTCEAFLYWGYAYIDTSMELVHPFNWEKRRPKIRNPQLRGVICKHLDLVLQVMPFNISSMIKYLKDWGYKDDEKPVKAKRNKGNA